MTVKDTTVVRRGRLNSLLLRVHAGRIAQPFTDVMLA
jgi:hypothetical protein